MLRNPLSIPPYFFGVELVFLVFLALTIRDVVRRYRTGDRCAAFQWLVVFAYGIAMELVAFNAYPDYEHGQFTIHLYRQQLPLYVTFVYVVFHYTGIHLVPRRGLRPLAAAVVTGLAIVLLDLPFDIVGVDARWWIWHPAIHDVAQRWLGVPLTSYEWYLLVGAVLAWLLAVLRPRIERLPLVAFAALAPVVALRARPTTMTDAPTGLRAITLLLVAWHLFVLALLWHRGEVAGGGEKLAVVLAVSIVMVVVFVGGRSSSNALPSIARASTDP